MSVVDKIDAENEPTFLIGSMRPAATGGSYVRFDSDYNEDGGVLCLRKWDKFLEFNRRNMESTQLSYNNSRSDYHLGMGEFKREYDAAGGTYDNTGQMLDSDIAASAESVVQAKYANCLSIEWKDNVTGSILVKRRTLLNEPSHRYKYMTQPLTSEHISVFPTIYKNFIDKCYEKYFDIVRYEVNGSKVGHKPIRHYNDQRYIACCVMIPPGSKCTLEFSTGILVESDEKSWIRVMTDISVSWYMKSMEQQCFILTCDLVGPESLIQLDRRINRRIRGVGPVDNCLTELIVPNNPVTVKYYKKYRLMLSEDDTTPTPTPTPTPMPYESNNVTRDELKAKIEAIGILIATTRTLAVELADVVEPTSMLMHNGITKTVKSLNDIETALVYKLLNMPTEKKLDLTPIINCTKPTIWYYVLDRPYRTNNPNKLGDKDREVYNQLERLIGKHSVTQVLLTKEVYSYTINDHRCYDYGENLKFYTMIGYPDAAIDSRLLNDAAYYMGHDINDEMTAGDSEYPEATVNYAIRCVMIVQLEL